MARIALDFGHGLPVDGGAIGYLREEDIINAYGSALKTELIAQGHEVVEIRITKAESVTHSLMQRVQRSNAAGADLFLSLHANDAVYQGEEKTDNPVGAEVYAISSNGRELGTEILQNIARLGFINRGVKDGRRIYVVARTNAPAVLIEPLFGDSQADVTLFQKVGAEAIAVAIASAVASYFSRRPNLV